MFNEFVKDDNRSNRPQTRVTVEAQVSRNQTFFSNSVQGRSVLDLGACVGFSGAYVLSKGAGRYVGVEAQPEYVEIATNLFKKHFPTNDVSIVCDDATEFANSVEPGSFDIVLLAGILHCSLDVFGTLRAASQASRDEVIIESIIPPLLLNGIVPDTSSLIEVGSYCPVNAATTNGSYLIPGSFATPQAIICMMDSLGFTVTTNQSAHWQRRFILKFKKSTDIIKSFKDDHKTFPIEEWNDIAVQPGAWVFNKKVANAFNQITDTNIPDYSIVQNKTVDFIAGLCSQNSVIADIGCATGNTLNILRQRGFYQTFGVDSSIDMIDKTRSRGFVAIHSNSPPNIKCDVVILNWTLHFIKNKESFLRKVVSNINPNGYLIITDKTTQSPEVTRAYYDWKKKRGLSDADIKAKEEALKGNMFINKLDWYLEEPTKLGVEFLDILHASYGFVTFVYKKNNQTHSNE